MESVFSILLAHTLLRDRFPLPSLYGLIFNIYILYYLYDNKYANIIDIMSSAAVVPVLSLHSLFLSLAITHTEREAKWQREGGYLCCWPLFCSPGNWRRPRNNLLVHTHTGPAFTRIRSTRIVKSAGRELLQAHNIMIRFGHLLNTDHTHTRGTITSCFSKPIAQPLLAWCNKSHTLANVKS